MNLFKRIINADRVVGLLFVVLGLIGALDTVFGTWRAGPGFGAKLFPQLVFLFLLLCGVLLMVLKPEAEKGSFIITFMEFVSLLLIVGSGALYFILLRQIGLVVTSLLYFLVLFGYFTVDPLKNWKTVVIPASIATFVVWLLFTQLVTILLPKTLLF